MTNPFDVPDADYLVLRNTQRQHSLWRAGTAVPEGWALAHGPATRAECLAYVRRHWIDLRPADVAAFVAAVSR